MKKINQELEVLLVDIPDAGLDVKATEKDEWLFAALHEAVGEDFSREDKATLNLRFLKFDDNVNVDGQVEFQAHRVCDRCAKEFTQTNVVPLHAVLIPKFARKRDRDEFDEGMEDDIIEGDTEFGTYEGDRVDASDFVRSAVILAMPMKILCKVSCAGICQKCGVDLNEGKCTCGDEGPSGVWAALKNFKVGQADQLEAPKTSKPAPRSKKSEAKPKKVLKKAVAIKKPLKTKKIVAKKVKKTPKKTSKPVKKSPKKTAKVSKKKVKKSKK